jgi:hypothetical protein
MVVSSGDQKAIAAEVNTSGQVALYWFDGAVKRCTGNSVMQLNAWNYFAIVVTSNAIAIYVNKTTADTLSGTTTLTNRSQLTTLGVGAYYNNNTPAQYFNGYLSNIRYSTTARTISVPTTPFVSDGNTRWLLNYTNAGIYDAAAKNVLETVGNAQVSTTQAKFGTTSMSFDGTGDYLVEPTNVNYGYGTGDFTIEFWVYFNNVTSNQTVVSNLSSASSVNPHLYIDAASNTLRYFTNNADRITSSALSSGQWYHITICRSGSSTKLFINGTQSGSTYTDANNYGASAPLGIGTYWSAGSPVTTLTLNGYIDEVRISKYARYTANFTAPTAAFPVQ